MGQKRTIAARLHEEFPKLRDTTLALERPDDQQHRHCHRQHDQFEW